MKKFFDAVGAEDKYDKAIIIIFLVVIAAIVLWQGEL